MGNEQAESKIDFLASANEEGDIDKPIYRVFPLWFFEEAIRLKRLTLCRPSRWDDPFEDLCTRVMMNDESVVPHTQTPLERYLRPAFAQCWSLVGDSDVLLRAYSRVSLDPHARRNTDPRFEGVQVQTTPRLLLQAADKWQKERGASYCCVGDVVYTPQDGVAQRIANYIDAFGAEAVGQGRLRAKLLLLKRDYFRHEQEVRLVSVFDSDLSKDDLVHMPIDVNTVFRKVRFDPRLQVFERRERERTARSLGYTGEFEQRGWYDGIFYLTGFGRGWKGRQLSASSDSVETQDPADVQSTLPRLGTEP